MAKKKEMVEETFDTKKIEKELEQFCTLKKEELLQDVSGKIDEQIEFRVNKRMKEEEKRFVRGKNAKIIRRDIVIILLLAILCYFTYCLYQVDYFQIRKVVVESPNTGNKEEVKTVSDDDEKEEFDRTYYIEHYRYLVDNLQINDDTIFSLYDKNITKDSISNELKLKIAYKNLSDEDKTLDNNMITIEESSLLESVQKIFGSEASFDNEMFTYNHTRFMFYNHTYLGFLEQEEEIGFLYEISDVKKEDDTLIFEVVVGKVSLDNQLLNLKNKVVLEKYNQENILEYQDQLSTYQIVFQEEDGYFLFMSLSSLTN